MTLPPVLEILPLSSPVTAEVAVPGSKSLTNRALVLAALARGATVLQGALWSEDTRVMVECLARLGFAVEVEADPREAANRTITVAGQGGLIPRSGTPEVPLELFVGNAGTAARFLTAFLCLGRGSYRLVGVPRMHERPQQPLFEALRALGYTIDAPTGRLPAVIHGAGPRPGRVKVGAKESSQFASALILAAETAGWQVEIDGAPGDDAGAADRAADPDELPYVEMTRGLCAAFPRAGGTFIVEPDASSGSYFWGAGWLLARGRETAGSAVRVAAWPTSGWQIDAEFPRFLPPPPAVSRHRDLGDSIMTAIVLAPFAPAPCAFTDLGRLRVQECERVLALRTELRKCGGQVVERGDTLEITPGPLHGASIETYGDHRMAMCFAMLGLAVPGMRILDPGCVAKTFPNFFAKLAAPPPAGLGAMLLDGSSGRPVPAQALAPSPG